MALPPLFFNILLLPPRMHRLPLSIRVVCTTRGGSRNQIVRRRLALGKDAFWLSARPLRRLTGNLQKSGTGGPRLYTTLCLIQDKALNPKP
jgi:hypothetical protein